MEIYTCGYVYMLADQKTQDVNFLQIYIQGNPSMFLFLLIDKLILNSHVNAKNLKQPEQFENKTKQSWKTYTT